MLEFFVKFCLNYTLFMVLGGIIVLSSHVIHQKTINGIPQPIDPVSVKSLLKIFIFTFLFTGASLLDRLFPL